MASFSEDDADFAGGAGSLSTSAQNYTVYATYVPLDSAYVSAYVGRGSSDIDTTRAASINIIGGVPVSQVAETAIGTTDSTQLVIGIGAGYDWYFGNAFVGATGEIDYSNTDVDGYAEAAPSLGLTFNDQTITSLQTTLGARAGYIWPFSWGAIIPEVRIGWVHEFDDDSRFVQSQLALAPGPFLVTQTDDPDRDFIRYGAGVTFQLPINAQAFIDYEGTASHSFLETWALTAGVQIEF